MADLRYQRNFGIAAHIDAGKALGFAWGSYRNHTADCIADFIATDNGLTSSGDIGQGLVNYCAWDDPKTATNEYYAARQQTRYVRSGYSYASYCAEIDAGRPVIIHLGSSRWMITGLPASISAQYEA